ncbi:MAG: hypothetical protein IT170_05715 [Bryobacterales bacterium]|nr:hypothetical protein [Bryobacterales bacterium]
MSTRQGRIEALEARLQDGFDKIGDAMARGVAVDHWEKTWVELLREYEALSDELAAAKPEQTTMPGLPRAEAS